MLNARNLQKRPDRMAFVEPALRDLHGGAWRQQTPPPCLFTAQREDCRAAGVLDNPSEIAKFYTANYGYVFSWGHLLEEHAAGGMIRYHFIPTDLLTRGVSIAALKMAATEWADDLVNAINGYVVLEDGPPFVPLTLRGELGLAREWIAEVFIPMYWDLLLEYWRETVAPVPILGSTLSDSCPVMVICVPSSPPKVSETVQLVLITTEGSPRICYATYGERVGFSATGWIDVPAKRAVSEQNTVDFIIDFYRTLGAQIASTFISPGLSSLVRVVKGFRDAGYGLTGGRVSFPAYDTEQGA